MNGNVPFSQVLPDRIRPGASVRDVVTSDRMNEIRDSIHALAGSHHISGNVATMGRSGFIIRQSRRVRRARVRRPFDLTLTPDGLGNITVRIAPGTINNLIPSNYLDNFTVGDSGTWYLTLNMTSVAGVVTAAEFETSDTAPDANIAKKNTPETFLKITIYTIIDGVAFRVIGSGNLTAYPNSSFRTNRAAPSPDQSPYDFWFTWIVNSY